MEGELEDGGVPVAKRKRILASFDIEDWFHAENVRAASPHTIGISSSRGSSQTFTSSWYPRRCSGGGGSGDDDM